MAENHVLLETIELTQSASSVTFDNIPQTGYTDLKVVMSTRASAYSTYTSQIFMRLNGSTSGYSTRTIGIGSSMAPTTGTAPYGVTNALYVAEQPTTALTSNTFGNVEISIPNYTSSTNKTVSIDGASENNSTTDYTFQLSLNSGLWSNTSAITSITFLAKYDFSGTFEPGSTFGLYGIAASDTTPAVAPKATGGNIVANDGTYWYHAFLTSGNFVPQTEITCDVLQVAGGGAAHYNRFSGGGGAGGALVFTSQLFSTSRTVTIGAGGAAGSSGAGQNGSNSQVSALTASVGGGGAGDASVFAGQSGGSGGGGAGYDAGAGGAATSGQGYAGGSGASLIRTAGGGGGAGGVGGNASSSYGGAGGVGITSALINAMGAATRTGELVSSNYYFAGGGGGSGYNNGDSVAGGGAGGYGGGAAGQLSNNSSGGPQVGNGTANTGGGAGGYAGNGGANIGNGGSGIVIIRYSMA